MNEGKQTNSENTPGEQEKDSRSLPWYVEIPVVVLCTLVVIMLIQTFIGRVYMIPSQSMEPTLHGCAGCTGDRIFVEKISYYFDDPEQGDVVVFKGTESWNTTFVSQRSENPIIRGLQNAGSFVGIVAPDENDLVKRVIATGGQTIQCLPGDAGVMVDGQLVDDSYVLHPPEYQTAAPQCGGDYFGPITVPADNIFVMGDNRTNSADSRYHLGDEYQGTIPVENIKGKASFIIYPFSRIGTIS